DVLHTHTRRDGIVLALEVAASIVRHRSYGPTKMPPTRNKREAKRESLDRFQLGHQSPWQIETNPDLTSEVEVRFFAETPNRTRVELEHRNLDRHGFGWEAVRG